ncbi:hypothetical protein KEJ49_04935 [Candidatus Bathyarchaeota archaeon]|nr:hypothetical protein [Candidatus Bathyarchaeota archaeon]
MTAQKAMTQLTLDPGNPPDWGCHPALGEEDLRSFGLAKHSETTRDAYVLDPDKVSRLSGPSNLAISPSRAAELLNLRGSYGFRLELRQALDVNVTRISASEFIVTVSTPLGSTPVAGANVTAAMYLYEGGFKALEPMGGAARTGVDGRCTLGFEEAEAETGIIFLVVDHRGLRTVKVIPVGSRAERARLLSDRLILGGDMELAGEALEIIPTYSDGVSALLTLTQAISRVEAAHYRLGYLEPGAEAVLAVSMDGSKLFYAPRVEELTYSTMEGENPNPFSYSLERSVVIGGSIYTLRLYIWRMTW